MVPSNAPDAAETDCPEAGRASAESVEAAARRQAVYAARRRDWANQVGRPYQADIDPRPPPGELDAEAEE